jgi:hypothetical protein
MPSGSIGIGTGSNRPTLSVSPASGFNSTGKVGINSLNPSAKLEVISTGSNTTTSAFLVKNGNSNPLLYVNDGSQVGVNTDFPNASLDVRGTTGIASSNALFVSGLSGMPFLAVKENARVGIGTDNPSAQFQVHEQFGNSSDILVTNSSTSSGLRLSSGFTGATIMNELPGDLFIGTGGNSTVQFMSTGQLIFTGTSHGFGTGLPTAKVHINGTFRLEDGTQAPGKVLTSDAFGNATWQAPAAATGWSLNGNTGTSAVSNFIGTSDNNALAIRTNNIERVRVTAAGSVGIGTTIPTSTFHANGSVSVAIRTTAIGTTLTGSDYCVVFTGSTAGQTITLPVPGSCPGRVYYIVNQGLISVALSIPVKKGASTTVNSVGIESALQIISDGTNWRVIGI